MADASLRISAPPLTDDFTMLISPFCADFVALLCLRTFLFVFTRVCVPSLLQQSPQLIALLKSYLHAAVDFLQLERAHAALLARAYVARHCGHCQLRIEAHFFLVRGVHENPVANLAEGA